METALESALRRDRAVVLAGLAALVIVAWLYLLRLGGDIILKIDGIAIGNVIDLVKIRERLGSLPSGMDYTITVLRAGKVMDLTGRAP